MSEQIGTAGEIELTVESIGKAVDGWYKQLLLAVDMEIDYALVRLAGIKTEVMALRTKAMRSQARVINAAATREIDPLLDTLADHARWLGRASTIRRGG